MVVKITGGLRTYRGGGINRTQWLIGHVCGGVRYVGRG